MNILYYGGCWPTNIGNAFIDYGSICTIKTAVPEATVHFASELPRWLHREKSIDLAELMEVDFAVVSGMNLCDEFLRNEGPTIKKLFDRGAKIIFNGCGGATYGKEEVNNFNKFFEEIKICGFISRDEAAFESYKDLSPLSYNGIDCAFFLKEAFLPAPLRTKEYVVYNFDSMREPRIESDKKVIRTHHSIDKSGRSIKYSIKRDTLISDIPDDYLNLYAHAHAVYSDRVHACIAALSFGNSARLYSTTPRAYLFERVGAGEIKDKLVKLDGDRLRLEKEKQIEFLRRIFAENV